MCSCFGESRAISQEEGESDCVGESQRVLHGQDCIRGAICLLEKDCNQYALIYEYIDGPTLLDAIIHSEYQHIKDLIEINDLWYQLSSALQTYSNQKSYIHMDIKPSNIMVIQQNDTLIYKIIDFGSAEYTHQTHFGIRTTIWYASYHESNICAKKEFCYSKQIDDIHSLIITVVFVASLLEMPQFVRTGPFYLGSCFQTPEKETVYGPMSQYYSVETKQW